MALFFFFLRHKRKEYFRKYIKISYSLYVDDSIEYKTKRAKSVYIDIITFVVSYSSSYNSKQGTFICFFFFQIFLFSL